MQRRPDSEIFSYLRLCYKRGSLRPADVEQPRQHLRDGYLFRLKLLSQGEWVPHEAKHAYTDLAQAEHDEDRLQRLAYLMQVAGLAVELREKEKRIMLYMPDAAPGEITMNFDADIHFIRVTCPGLLDTEYSLTPEGMCALLVKLLRYIACHPTTPVMVRRKPDRPKVSIITSAF